jgi:hypothetical protein
MQLVSTITVGVGGASSITFSGIPQTGTDLLVLVSGRASWPSSIRGNLSFNFNSNSTGYTAKAFGGYNFSTFLQNDSTTGNIRLLNSIPAGSATANTFNNASFYVSNYTAATSKSIVFDGVMENNANTSGLGIVAGLWNNTAAITTLRVTQDEENFVAGSTASLYLITKA